MGYGSYSTANYAKTSSARAASGTAFTYDRTARATGHYVAHEKVDPKKLNAAGLNIRESRDRDGEEALPLCVAFDSTGSMANTPRTVQQELNKLFGLIIRKGYIGEQNPQLMISSYGDAYTDRVPLQVSQFESSDTDIEENLNSLVLEGNGGGNGGETASLLWYYLNKHAVTDSYDKRGKKGYFFMIADEVALDLKPSHIKDFIGDEAPAEETLTTKKLAAELQEKWEVFVLLIDNSSAHWQGSQKFYTDLFGAKNVIILENDKTVSETIGAVIGRMENDDLDDDELIEDLISEGTTKEVASATAKAVAKLGGTPKGSVAKTGLKVTEASTGVQFV